MNRYWSILVCCAALFGGCHTDLEKIKQQCSSSDLIPQIKPDYSGITIPPNIAPLQFSLKDSSSASIAEISSVNGFTILVKGKKGKFFIDDKSWKRLLSKNPGNPLYISIYTRTEKGKWLRYKTIENTIAREPIDQYCTYRLLNFQYSYWRDLRECERDLTSFRQRELLSTMNYSQYDQLKCINCHIPMNNDPGHFTLQLRSNSGGVETLIANGDSLALLSSRIGHVSWHPEGRYIAFSSYKVQQYFHSVGRQFIDVYDNDSYIAIYDISYNKIISLPQLSQQGTLNTWPAWSADGQYLYYCSAPILWSDNGEPPQNFNRTRYSLLRIAYDIDKNIWGKVDTVLTPEQTGLSIAMPRISPDNKFCLFCMQNYGPYPYIDASSDLYLMDLRTSQYRKLNINSEYNESYHSWSQNGRWIIFSSRRDGGIFTRLYISHIDSMGNASKAFILPQRDGEFYDSFLKCYNVAEFAVAPVSFSQRKLQKAIQSHKTIKVDFPPELLKRSAGNVSNEWSPASSRE